jgi:hypothetical protein
LLAQCSGQALGLATKKGPAIGQKLSTTAGNYLLLLADQGTAQPAAAALLLATDTL